MISKEESMVKVVEGDSNMDDEKFNKSDMGKTFAMDVNESFGGNKDKSLAGHR